MNILKSSPAIASLTMEPYSANELYETAINNPPPPPNLLTLEGRYIGRGGKVCRYEDGIIRQFWVETNELRVWHISEFARYEIPLTSHGQFHREDTYVIRWSYKIAYSKYIFSFIIVESNMLMLTLTTKRFYRHCSIYFRQTFMVIGHKIVD
ncbi:unnamed protein product [Schistosoma curassoni]|uniref:FBA_3 domain-containing protein n=1 Tax=Schistosoma curassoni TaxID=6186 RepID=A0A183JMI2_9TREM|nr:unnamed protein product [Schistosoma curassoni]